MSKFIVALVAALALALSYVAVTISLSTDTAVIFTLDQQCRGGSGDAQSTQRACELRDKLEKQQ